MRLRNKETGEIVKFLSLDLVDDGEIEFTYVQASGHENAWSYRSLERFNDEWEDYVPKEPFIKDEKIRKAIRAWAEANDANVVSICALSGGWGVRYDLEDREGYGSIDLLFKGNAPLGVGNSYTIEELCGEEEE